MKQAFLKAPFIVEIRDVELPALAADEALIAVKACGVCGSDLNSAQTAQEFKPFGHEFAGVVEAVGAGVKNVRVGDRVCVESSSYCGKCAMCRNGHPELCQDKYIFAPRYNAFAEKVIAKSGALVNCEGISFEEAAIVEPMGVAMDMVEVADIQLNDHVVVYGAGPIALLAVRLARLKGAGKVTVLAHSHSTARIAMAKFYGADRIVCTDRTDPCKALKGERVDRVLVTTPPSTLKQAVEFASFGAIISMIGIAKNSEESQCTLDINKMHFRRLQLRYSFASPALFFPLCIDMIKNGLVDVKPLISHRFTLEEMDKAMLTCRDDKAGAVKVMMVAP
ncbi:MAG: alcohol dehydrogenase catalytic domain-containing protein [Clostridia bacterium]|nr:alcohol dehydrogenase catalytic domain-containing protein [Clostridia bacterium]